ncbi:MAG TPA: ABC transporter permease subunit [Gemmatimonadales bacterium]|jgi:NitT/TauT family transport system permease protein|nr:ABC transporter permease subunit [Gemmatimonadales bacterium]
MKQPRIPPALTPPRLRRLGLADVAILCLVGGAIAAVVAFAREFEAPFAQAITIDLRFTALPRYTLYSLSRGVLALLISYLFALGFGWAAAKSRAAERLLLPMLDILQSIPVLGFLPGLVLGLMSLFPTRNVGLELAAILMIFTAQAWNLALSFYNSLKALPEPLRDACKVAGWPERRTFWQLEVPAAAQGLVWNGMLSMAGGWFFLMVNEAFRLGERDYRLPGIGSYMSVALDQGNVPAMVLAIAAMTAMIVAVDQLLWRPLVVWVEKFRLDETAGGGPAPGSWVLDFLRRARLPRSAAVLQRRAYRSARRAARPLERPFRAVGPVIWRAPRFAFDHPIARKLGGALVIVAIAAAAALGAHSLWLLLAQLGIRDWGTLVASAALTFARVMGAVILSTAWALPAGVWIGRSPRLASALQPVIQVVASFPAPMLFPIVILLFERIGIGLGLGAVGLMVLAGQWYILFNVISAVAAIPEQLKDASTVFRLPRLARWRMLYLPASFPALVTGWVTAAGGAWNGSIVAEYIEAGGKLRTTSGLGSLISVATAHANFPLLAGGIALMSLIVVGWNRLVWRSLMQWAQERFGLAA